MITLIFWEEVVDDNAQSASVQYCIVDGRLLPGHSGRCLLPRLREGGRTLGCTLLCLTLRFLLRKLLFLAFLLQKPLAYIADPSVTIRQQIQKINSFISRS